MKKSEVRTSDLIIQNHFIYTIINIIYSPIPPQKHPQNAF